MVNRFVTTETLASSIPWSPTRGTDFRVLAFVIYYCHRLNPVTLLRSFNSQAGLISWLSQPDDIPHLVRTRVVGTLETMVKLTQGEYAHVFKSSRWKKVAPIEMIGICVLVGSHLASSTSSLGNIAEDIGKLRQSLRHDHPNGLLLKPEIFSTMFQFIASKAEARAQPAVPSSSSSSSSLSSLTPLPELPRRQKRKRVGGDTYDPDEEHNSSSEEQEIVSLAVRSTARSRLPSRKVRLSESWGADGSE